MNYLITFNHTQTNFDPQAIHESIIKMPGITDWWHYIPNVYIVSTSKDESYIADYVISRYPGLLFLVVLVNLTKHNGVLNKKAWEWISNKNKMLLKVKPAPQPPKINDFLGLPPITPYTTTNTGSPFLDEILKRIK